MNTHVDPRSLVAGDAAQQTVLVAGNYRPALTAARWLKAAGYRVMLGIEPDSTGAEASRFVDAIWHMPPAERGIKRFREALAALLRDEPGISVILPMKEATLNLVAAARDIVPARIRIAAPQNRVLAICHDKFAWLKFCRDIGIPMPEFDTAGDLETLRGVVARIGGPVVIRPVEAGQRIGRRKAVSLYGGDFDDAFAQWPEEMAGDLLVQKRFEGERYNVYFGALGGEIVRELHSKSLRTDRWDGSGQTIEGEVVDPIAVHSEMVARAARALDYTGVGCAQFLLDPVTGETCFLEINPRFGASYAFVEHAGFELTRLALELSENDPDPRPLARAPRKVRFVWTYGDLSGLVFSYGSGDITARQGLRWGALTALAALRADVHVTWSWRDPWPTLHAYGRQFLRLAGIGRRRPAAMAAVRAPDAVEGRE